MPSVANETPAIGWLSAHAIQPAQKTACAPSGTSSFAIGPRKRIMNAASAIPQTKDQQTVIAATRLVEATSFAPRKYATRLCAEVANASRKSAAKNHACRIA